MKISTDIGWAVYSHKKELIDLSERLVELSGGVLAKKDLGTGMLNFEGIVISEVGEVPAFVEAVLAEDQLKAGVLQRAIFDQEEMDSAELFCFYPDIYASDRPASAPYREVTCPRCRLTYRIQLSFPLKLVKPKRLTGLKVATIHGEDALIMSGELVERLWEWGLREEIDAYPIAGTTLFQVVPKWILPELDPRTPFSISPRACPVCGRYAKVPFVYVYRRADLGPVRDLGFAPHYYSMNMLATGSFVISRRLLELFKENKVRAYSLRPIFIED